MLHEEIAVTKWPYIKLLCIEIICRDHPIMTTMLKCM